MTQIVEYVRGSFLFGLVGCDVRVPPHLKDQFAAVTPIFTYVNFSKDDIVDHMKACIEETRVQSQHHIEVS